MDGALWVTPEIARAKANAAAAFHATTLDLEERFGKRQLFADNVATLGDYRFVFAKGAVPLVEDGRIVCADGVRAAGPAGSDHTIVEAGAGHTTPPQPHQPPLPQTDASRPQNALLR